MRKLHILHTESSCGWGGQEIRILTESLGMIKRGHQVTLLCPARAQIFSAAKAAGIPVVALDIEKKRLSSLWVLRRWLARHKHGIDIINTHSSTDAWLTAIACATLSKAPSVIRTRHVSSPINNRFTTRWLYQSAVRHLVVTGEPLRQRLAAHNRFALSSMTSVPTGIDLARFLPRNRQETQQALGLDAGYWVGILATLRNWKGHRYLFHALVQLKPHYPALKLLVIGDGPQRQNLEKLAVELHIEDVVRFVGNQQRPEEWLPALELFVLPSYGDEGVSQAVLQAMACRLAVITTDVGGMRDAVQDKDTGLLVQTKDSEAIAEAIQSLMTDPALRERLAEAAYARVQQYFGVETMLDRMENIFSRYAQRAD